MKAVKIMDHSKNLLEKYDKLGKRELKKSQYLHSPSHLLADELSQKFREPKRFGFYLKMAELYDHNFLRRIAGKVMESDAKKPGALFAYLIKKERDET